MNTPRKFTDPTERVVIPVTIRGGKIVPFYGGEMPKLREANPLRPRAFGGKGAEGKDKVNP